MNSQEIEEEEKSPRVLIGIIGGILIILLVSYFLFSDILSQTIGSEVVQNNTLLVGNYSIYFEGNTLAQLQQEYLGNQEREIKACLYGKVKGRNYYVENVTLPEIIDADVMHVKTAGCFGDPIITLHSHPVKKCLASQQDIDNFRKAINPELLLMVMCDTDRFAVIDQNT
ncbi:hypothetical protein KY329_04835 [Candidatus Woesearchaeota archaeon]|nr:hypothetical protein [Candidatus Woesearchaeota archaeon]